MISMSAFSDEMVKIAVAKHLVEGAKGLKGFIAAHPKALGYGGAAVAGGVALKGGERLYENQLMAEAMRERMAAARGA